MTKSLRSGNNYGETRNTPLGPAHAEIWVIETIGAPEYVCGTLVTILRIAGAQNPRARIKSFDGRAATFDVSWDPKP